MVAGVVQESPQRRWLLAGGCGLALALLTRVGLLLATAPHSTRLFHTPAWHLGLAAAVGVAAWLLVFARARRPGAAAAAIALAALALALLAHRQVFNVELVNGWWPGFWIE
jgi:hypothetical protein